MTMVFLLWHVHEISSEQDDDKLIGVYSTKENAEHAISRTKNRPGFNKRLGRFEIAEYVLDEDNWRDGFICI